jgi:hypothetical protein
LIVFLDKYLYHGLPIKNNGIKISANKLLISNPLAPMIRIIPNNAKTLKTLVNLTPPLSNIHLFSIQYFYYTIFKKNDTFVIFRKICKKDIVRSGNNK